MNGVLICEHKQVKHPYYIEQVDLRIYSMEELAYFLYHNSYLVDGEILSEKLCRWIGREAGCRELAERLAKGLKAGIPIPNLILAILHGVDYCTAEELNLLSEQMKRFGSFQIQERMKLKADELLKNQNYGAALAEYEKILAIRQSEKLGVGFYGKVWHNKGVCYGRLFLFAKAQACFLTAYEYDRDPETAKAYWYVQCLMEAEKKPPIPEQLQKAAQENFRKESLRALESPEYRQVFLPFKKLEAGEQREAYEMLQQEIGALQREYHKNLFAAVSHL